LNHGFPGYLELYESGELLERAGRLNARLTACDICPRRCGVNRLEGETGICRTGSLAVVASVGAHHGEEPVLSGHRGSGTIFFSGCNLRCCYCQNWQISQAPIMSSGREVTAMELAEKMLYLQNELECHNINLVTPSHVVPQIVAALIEAIPQGLDLPLVYNTSSYDSLATLQAHEGIVDIYLADLRYASDKHSSKYSGAPDYVSHARTAIMEMQRQVGDLVVDNEGIARRGLIIRHLILPGDIAGSEESLRWLVEEVSPNVAVSIMSQYYPSYKAGDFPELNRKITYEEYRRVVRLVNELGIENGWIQDMAAPEHYRPDFTQEKPFSF